MGEQRIELTRRTFLGGAAAAGAALAAAAAPGVAFGVTSAEKQAEADAVRAQLLTFEAELDQAAERYWGAVDEMNAAQASMEAEQVKIDETNEKIVKIQERLGTRVRSMYTSGGSSTAIDFLLGAASFEEFVNNWNMLGVMNDNDNDLVVESKQLREELQAARDEYARQKQVAEDKAEEAKAVQDEVAQKVADAQALVATLDAEAQALLEEEQAAAAAAAAAEEAARIEQEYNNNNGGGNGGGGNSGGGGGWSGGGGAEIPSQGSVVDYALSRIGCPYVWGAEGPDAFDCSGLVTWAYRQIGMSIPHQSEAQYAVARQRVPVSEARPGDVLWRYGHVGIAVGYGGVPYVHAPTFGAYVRDTDPLSWSGFTHALRF